MFSTLRTRFGIPGVISVIALVFAMFGGAYAASNSSGGGKATASAKAKKGPTGPKGAKGATGPAGAQGPAGPAGAKGDAGANGANGAAGPTGPTGTAGAKGATGAAGATGFSGFTETLPSGKTETGSWAISVAATGFMQSYGSISFPIPLAQAGEEEGDAVAFNEAETRNGKFGKNEISEESCVPGEPECVATGCTGTAAKPTAPPGKLCVYTTEEIRESASGDYLLTTNGILFGAYGVSGTAILGPFIGVSTESQGYVNAYGSWAVTAP
jgi:hypothetical protein